MLPVHLRLWKPPVMERETTRSARGKDGLRSKVQAALPAVFLIELLLVLAAPALAEWPQWRGPEGRGVAAEPQALPTSWEPDGPNVRWRTPIPGEGTSSPIASNGRVFVTTAYEGRQGALLDRLLVGGVLGLALVFLWLAVRALRRAPHDAAAPRRALERRDSRLVAGVSLAFVVVAVALALAPDAFYELGNPGRAWRVTGGMALLGLSAAVGWFRPGSRWRPLGAALVLVGATLLAWATPSTPLGPAPLERRIVLLVPGLALAGWHLYAFRRLPAGAGGPQRHRPWLAVPLVLLAALVFFPANYLNALLRVVVCLDLESGEVLWERAPFAAAPEQKWERGTYAMPTPATDGETVFAYFGSGLAALDYDGKLLWSERFPGYARYTRYGAATSPVLTADAVIVVQESEAFQGGPPSWIAAFDKRSGRRLWEIEPPGARDSYGTPLLWPTANGTQLVTASWKALVGYDAGSGERLWSLDYPMEQMVASLAHDGDVIAVTGGVYGDKAMMVLRPAVDGSGVELLWESRRGVASISTPVFYDGKLFTVTDGGIMTCYDAATGDQLWKQRLGGDHFASLVAGDGKIYAVSIEGEISVIAAGPEFQRLAVNRLDGAVYASPAIAGGCLLLRTADSLYCIEAEGGGEPVTAAGS